MSLPVGGWPYPTVPADGQAAVDDDGENQTCACGNDSWTTDWAQADRSGRLTFEASGSADPEEFAVCPVCGRVYSNAALFDAAGGSAAAVTRYDVHAPSFIVALRRYNHDAYGDSA